MELRIDEIIPKKGEVYPQILNFQNGHITEDFPDLTDCILLKDKHTDQKTVAACIDEVVYEGVEEKENLGKTFILSRNRITGKVRLIEVGIVSMKVTSKDIVSINKEVKKSDHLELSRKFGSKKQKQQMEQREKLKVNISTVSQQMERVTEAAANVSSQDLSAYLKTDSDDFYIPPINRDAQSVNDVYNIDDILSPDQIKKIASEIAEKDYSSELTPYMKGLVAGRKSFNPTEMALILYANTLLKLYVESYKEIIKKSFRVCDVSNSINDFVLANFTQMSNNKRTRPNPLKDKALCHIIVILLILSDFKFEMESFATAVKVSPFTIGLKSRTVGCTIVNGPKKTVQLKLPLTTGKSFSRRKSAKF